MDEDSDTPLILDRPFLNTAGTQIDVRGDSHLRLRKKNLNLICLRF
jgi:hypothetical protein